MEAILEDRFVVYVQDHGPLGPPAEYELASCSTYQEALQVRQELGGHSQKCIIRFLGPAGGGD